MSTRRGDTRVRLHLAAVALTAAVAIAAAGCGGGSDERSPTPANVGKRIDELVSSYLANDATGSFTRLRTVAVSVHGKRVYERYFHSRADAHLNVESVGKTILGTLVGIAIHDGKLHGIEQTLAELLPAYRADMTPRVSAITLGQLLTMTGGLPDDDAFYPAVFDTDRDWVRTALVMAGRGRPVEGFAYASAGSHLISAILQEATGETAFAYARRKLFEPLGIATDPAYQPVALARNLKAYARAEFAWPTDPHGRNIGGGGQKLTARDLLVLGQLWLQAGSWHGRQLVPAAWEQAAQKAQVRTVNGLTEAYGYQQWVTTCDGHPAFAAAGFGGQVVEVVPALRLVAVVQSTTPPGIANGDPPGAGEGTYLSMVCTLIAPAVAH